MADLDQIVRLKPKDPQSYVERSILSITMKQYDRARQDASRLVELCPQVSIVYDFRALVICLTSQDRKAALADLDHAIKLEPRHFLSYGFRAFLNVENENYLRAFGNLAMCGMTLNQCEFHFTWKIDRVRSRFYAGVHWRLKEEPMKLATGMLALEPERRSIEQGVERLLAAALER